MSSLTFLRHCDVFIDVTSEKHENGKKKDVTQEKVHEIAPSSPVESNKFFISRVPCLVMLHYLTDWVFSVDNRTPDQA